MFTSYYVYQKVFLSTCICHFIYMFLLQTQNGNVEAKVMCFYRRRDISNTLILLADKHHSEYNIFTLQNCIAVFICTHVCCVVIH